jgi:hypothetical protein
MAERHPHLFEDVGAAKTLANAANASASGSTEMTALARGGGARPNAGVRSIGANGDVVYRIDEFGIDDDGIGIETVPEMSQSQQQPAWRRFMKSASTSSTSLHDQPAASAATLARAENEYHRASLGTSLESQDEDAAGGSDGGVATVGFHDDDENDAGAYEEEDEDANEYDESETALRAQDEADSVDA